MYALDRLEIDELGLDNTDRRMMEAIISFYGGGPVGLDTLAATIPEEDKVTALCMGSLLSRVASEDMLQTMLLKRVGAKTVVDGINGEQDRYWADCGIEKIFELDPDYIFVVTQGDEEKARQLYQNAYLDQPAWNGLQAVRNDRVYLLPKELFQFKPNARWDEAYAYIDRILRAS